MPCVCSSKEKKQFSQKVSPLAKGGFFFLGTLHGGVELSLKTYFIELKNWERTRPRVH